MILSRNLSEAFNAQVNAEMWSSNLYLSMSVYFQKAGLNGFAHWMKKQAAEELEHAHKLIDYALDRGGDITIGQLVDIAEADKDHASRDFLFWFVREQVEEESTAKEIVDQLKNYGECHYAIMDHRLGKR